MTITTKYTTLNSTSKVLGAQEGDEVLFRFKPNSLVIIEGYVTSPGEVGLYSSIKDTPTVVSTADLVDTGIVFTETFQEGSALQGQSWAGLKVLSGTWDFYIRAQEV